jgi:hypothetical protein
MLNTWTQAFTGIMSFNSLKPINVIGIRREHKKSTNFYPLFLLQSNLPHLILHHALVHVHEHQTQIIHVPTLVLILDPILDSEVDRKVVDVEDNNHNNYNNHNNNNNNLGNNKNNASNKFLLGK